MTPKTLPEKAPAPASIKTLRTAVISLGTKGTQEVRAVRSAFVSGVPPLQTVSSGSKADFITRFSEPGMGSEIIRSTAQFGLNTSLVSAPVPPPRPELDLIEVSSDRSFGVLDSFFTRLVFSLPSSEVSKVQYFRVLRASTGRVASAPIPAFSAVADSSPLGAKTKSAELISNQAFRAAGIGVGNALTNFVADDTFSNQRVVVAESELRPLPAIQNSNRKGSSSTALLSVANADRSVLENVVFYVNQRTVTPRTAITLPLGAGQRQGVNVLQGNPVGSSTSIIAQTNQLGFAEVARIFSSKGRRVGDFTEFEYFDPSVIYGASYSYYIEAVSPRGFASVRSRIIPVNIVRSIPPATPIVMFAVLGGVPRFSIACSGSFTDHIEVFRKGGTQPPGVQLLSTDKAMIDRGPSVKTDAGFYHVGDIGIGPARTGIFVDRTVSSGAELEYRIYSVDSFGLKSATPFSCSISLPDHGKVVPLGTPSITAEQAAGDRVIQITVSCDDNRVTSFCLSRRELSTRESLYRQPTHPAYFTLGDTTSIRAHSRSGPSLNQFSSKAWNGILKPISGTVHFNDTAIEFDRIYQYSVHGIDIRGNITANVPATPVFVAVKPVSDAPTAVTGTLVSDDDGNPSGVLISWSQGTIDFSPLDLIGNQDVLAANSQRSVFQVERRSAGSPNWSPLPATTASHFFDPVSSVIAPKFRPEFVSLNAVYDYRVIAMQSGAFISAHTDPVRVIITPEISPPSVIFIRSASTAIRPISIVVSWDYSGIFVDGWEIERAVTNKLFGARIPSMDSNAARGLTYEGIGKITRESSRGLGVSSDGRSFDPRVFAGNRFFVDRDVSMANSYFYRVRALDATGRFSSWTYGGILLTDSPFDRKFMSTLSDDDKSRLSLDQRPLPGWEGK